MRMLSLIPVLLMLLLLEGQSMTFPSQARAINCCPCFNPCKLGCQCRGPGTHCPSCRVGGSDVLQYHAVAIDHVLDVRTSGNLFSFALNKISLREPFLETLSGSQRAGRNTTLRLLGDSGFRLIPWCPAFS